MVQKQNVEFTAKDDVILRGWLFVPEDPGPHPAITMAHGFEVFAGTTAENIRAAAREAERLGYASFWVNHPGSTDGLAALAHAGVERDEAESVIVGFT